MTTGHAIYADVTEPGRGVGWVHDGVDFYFHHEGRKWKFYGGDADQIRAQGDTLNKAVQAFARVVGVTGTAVIHIEYEDDKARIIDLPAAP